MSQDGWLFLAKDFFWKGITKEECNETSKCSCKNVLNESPNTNRVENNTLEDTKYLKITKQSSVSSKGVHMLQDTPSPNVRGGNKVEKKLFVEVSGHFNSRIVDSDIGKHTRLRKAGTLSHAALELTRKMKTSDTCKIIGTFFDKQKKENLPEIIEASRNMPMIHMLSPDDGCNLKQTANLTDTQYRQTNNATKHRGIKFLPPEKKMLVAKRGKANGINRDFYNVTTVNLQIKRQGKEKYTQELRPAVIVKKYKELLQLVIENELENLDNLDVAEDGSQIIKVGLSGDSGAGSTKHSFALLDRKDGKIIQHIMIIYEAADTTSNNIKVHSEISSQVKSMNGAKIIIDGNEYVIHQIGIYDLHEQDQVVENGVQVLLFHVQNVWYLLSIYKNMEVLSIVKKIVDHTQHLSLTTITIAILGPKKKEIYRKLDHKGKNTAMLFREL